MGAHICSFFDERELICLKVLPHLALRKSSFSICIAIYVFVDCSCKKFNRIGQLIGKELSCVVGARGWGLAINEVGDIEISIETKTSQDFSVNFLKKKTLEDFSSLGG